MFFCWSVLYVELPFIGGSKQVTPHPDEHFSVGMLNKERHKVSQTKSWIVAAGMTKPKPLPELYMTCGQASGRMPQRAASASVPDRFRMCQLTIPLLHPRMGTPLIRGG
jgi:hypothetical protein